MKKRLNNLEEKLHMKFSQWGRDYKEMRNKLLMLLPEIVEAGIAGKLGFENIYDYARQVAGLSGSAVYRALRLDKKLRKLPKLRAAIEKVGINKVEIAARVANEENEEFWTDKVLHMSKRPLELSVKEELYAKKLATGGENNASENYSELRPCFAAPEKVKVSLSFEAQKSFNRLKSQMKIETGTKADEKAMEIMLKRLEAFMANITELKPKKAQIDVKNQKQSPKITPAGINQEKEGRYAKAKKNREVEGHYVKAKKKREVEERSGKICEYSGCTKLVENMHHRERFAKKKSHKTLTGLCKAHHEMLHNSFVINELDTAENWKTMKKTNSFKALGFIDQKLRDIKGSALLS